MKWSRTAWMFFYFIISGTYSLITVEQTPVLTAALGDDVTLPCQLKLSHNVNVTSLVLYWLYVTEDNNKKCNLWPPSEKNDGDRVHLLDTNAESLNKSILLRNVQWADGGKYVCKMSINTEKGQRFRKRGNESLLVVHDTMAFDPIKFNDTLLQCKVNVTWEPGLILSIFHHGRKSRTVHSDAGDAAVTLPYITLSETISLQGAGEYECQLHLNEDMITKSIFIHSPSTTPGIVATGTGNRLLTTHLTTLYDMELFPEPWLLYLLLLLVPITILLLVLTVQLIRRR